MATKQEKIELSCSNDISVDLLRERIGNVRRINPQLSLASENEIIATRLIVQIARKIERNIEANMEKDGLVGASWMVLIMTYSSEEQKVIASDICDALGQNKSTTSRIVDSLIEKGFVQRKPDVKDRRKVYLYITDIGKKYVEEQLPIHDGFTKKLWAEVDVEQHFSDIVKLYENSNK